MTFAAIVAGFNLDRAVAFAVIGAGAGMYWFYQGFRLLQRKRLILNTPSAKIRSASMGLVEISGLATSPYVMTSPLKQVECYYYRSIAWELKQRGKDSQWVKVAEETLHVPFYVDDGSGKVLIDPSGAEMDLHCDFQERYNRSILFEGPEMAGCVSSFLLRHGADPTKRVKVEEYCVKPHNSLFVLGTLSQNPGLDASVMPAWAEHAGSARTNGMGEVAQEVIRLSNGTVQVSASEMTQQQKIAAALVKAGVSSPAAWAAVGVGAPSAIAVKTISTSKVQAATAVEERPEATPVEGFDLHPSVVLMKGNHDPVFFISWRSQRDVISSLGWKSSLMIWGGPALTLACVYFLIAHFG
jgi:hypothetical protein